MQTLHTELKEIYKIKKILGVGTFGKVRKVQNRFTGKNCACKYFKNKKLDHSDRLDIVNEISLMEQLDHPNIVRLEQIVNDERYTCMIMELCDGGNLLNLMEKEGTLKEEDARAAIISLVDAVNYCHERDILHRDIKLENIFLK